MFLNQHKVIGVLGGMGPKATMDFYHRIIELTDAGCEQEHISTLIFSNPKVPCRIAAFNNNDGSEVIEYLQQTAKIIEQAGADVLVMPCNSAHIYFEPMAQSIDIPALNMVELTVNHIVDHLVYDNGIGLLCTTALYDAGLYQQALEKRGIEVIEPNTPQKQQIMSAIQDIKFGRNLKQAAKVFTDICNRWPGPAIMGCTEIPIVGEDIDALFGLVNPTEILAQAAIDYVHSVTLQDLTPAC